MKIGGERAYRLARQGVQLEMPLRRSQVYALDVITYTGDNVQLGLHVSSGTYVRSIATALGGHCTTLRRTAVGPFRVEEADPERLLPVSEALGRLPAEAIERVPYGLRAQVLALETETGAEPPTEGWPDGFCLDGGSAAEVPALPAPEQQTRERRATRPSSSAGRGRSRSAPSTASTSAIAR